jgi:hypothetical protein
VPRDLSQEPRSRRRRRVSIQSPDDAAKLRRLASNGGWTRRERLMFVLYPVRHLVSDVHYASKRMIELQMRLP